MVERIREILSSRQLTPTQFADTIGVARPIVSHILSGRNKPSLEVVQKIVAAFPDLSMSWILVGEGPMDAPKPVDSTPLPPLEPQSGAKPSSKPPESATGATKSRPAASGVAKENTAPLAASFAFPPSEPAELAAAAPPSIAAVPPVPAAAEMPLPVAPPASAASVPVAKASIPAPEQAIKELAQSFAEPDKAIRRIVIFYQDGTFATYRPE